MEEYIQKGISKKLISLSDDEKQITYLHQNKTRNYTNPEEIVQAKTFIKLVVDYGYKPQRILQFVTVTMGSEKREADIVVYQDDECTKPHILVECKRQEVSEPEFLQAIEQAYSYAYALPNDVKHVWVTSGIKNEYLEVDKTRNSRESQPDIPQFGAKSLATYKFVYEADEMTIKEGQQKYFDLKTIPQEDLTRRFKLAHDALWGGGQLNPSEAFDELDKLIFCKIWDERKDRTSGIPYDFQIITIDKKEEADPIKRRALENASLATRVKAIYELGRAKDAQVFRDDIRLSNEKIRTIVGYLQDINLSETDLDSKGRAFETFMDSFFRGNFGQFFTPRTIVDFTVSVLPITKDSFVMDTSCGSGGFLLYALNKVRKEADKLYPNHKTDVKQNAKHFKYWHDFAEKNLYGIEINEQISRAAKMNMIIHDDGHTNVITSDGLVSPEQIEEETKNQGFKYNHFDFIITNPPFGATIKKSENNYLGKYDFGKKFPDWLDVKGKTTILPKDNQTTEVLFIEQDYNFLKEGGYLGIVIPDGILTNSSMQYVRDSIEDKYRIVAVVSMPQTAFSATGAGVKSSVMFLKKHSKKQTYMLVKKKSSIQFKLREDFNFYDKVNAWDKEKKKKLKNLDGFNNTTGITAIAELKKTLEYKEWRDEVNSFYNDLINDLKEELQDAYIKAKQDQLPDYPIFMAIAEDIGFDATGKKTSNNELEFIGKELSNFIKQIEDGRI